MNEAACAALEIPAAAYTADLIPKPESAAARRGA
jgi:hypothetical protein